MISNCADSLEMGDWLKGLFTIVIFKKKPIRMLPVAEFPRLHRVAMHAKNPSFLAKILDFLDRQNPGLRARDWIVTRGTGKRDRTHAYFSGQIEDSSLRVLTDRNFKSFCGLCCAFVRLLDKETAARPDKAVHRRAP